MKKMIVVGSSGHAKVVIDIIERSGEYEIKGLVDRFRAAGDETSGYPVLGKEEDLPRLAGELGFDCAVVAIGDNAARSEVAERVEKLIPHIEFVKAIHPSAQIGGNVSVGRGSVIMAGAVLNPDASVGAFCIVNTKASLDHDSTMDDFSSLAPGATLGGKVRIGAFAAVGLGASVIHGVSVGEQTVVGAGSTVVKDLEPFVVAYGTPARVVRSRKAGDKYL